MHASQGRHTSSDGGSHSRASTRTTPSNGPPQQERASTTPQSGKTSIKKASDKIQSLLDASSIRSCGGATVSHNELMQLAEWLRQSSEPQAPLQQTLDQILQRLSKIENKQNPSSPANRTWAAVAALPQHRVPTPLKTTTGHTITIRPNTEKAEGLRGQSETEVLTEIRKEVHDAVAVRHLRSGDIRVTLRDQQAKERAVKAGDRLGERIGIKVLRGVARDSPGRRRSNAWLPYRQHTYTRNAKTPYPKRNNHKWPHIQRKALQPQTTPRTMLPLRTMGTHPIHMRSTGVLRPLCRPPRYKTLLKSRPNKMRKLPPKHT